MTFTLTYLLIAGLIGLGLGCLIGFGFGRATDNQAAFTPLAPPQFGHSYGTSTLRGFITHQDALTDIRKELARVRIRWAQHFAEFEARAALDRARLDSLGTKVTAVLSNCTLANAPVVGRTDRASQGTGLPVDVGHRPCRGSETLETASDDCQGVSERPAVHTEAKCQACSAAREICAAAIRKYPYPVSSFRQLLGAIRCPRHADHLRADGSAQARVSSRTDR